MHIKFSIGGCKVCCSALVRDGISRCYIASYLWRGNASYRPVDSWYQNTFLQLSFESQIMPATSSFPAKPGRTCFWYSRRPPMSRNMLIKGQFDILQNPPCPYKGPVIKLKESRHRHSACLTLHEITYLILPSFPTCRLVDKVDLTKMSTLSDAKKPSSKKTSFQNVQMLETKTHNSYLSKKASILSTIQVLPQVQWPHPSPLFIRSSEMQG